MKMLTTARRLQSLATRASVITSGAASRRTFHRSAVTAFPEIPFKLADIGEGIAEVEVLQWFVKEGEPIKQFQNVCEVQSDKATVEITSRYDGVVKKVHYKLGEMAKVGTTLIDIEVDDATAAAFQASAPSAKPAMSPTRRVAPTPVAAAPKKVAAPTPAPVVVEVAVSAHSVAPVRDAAIRQQRTSGDDRVLTSPSVRRLAKEHDIDLLDVVGTGPDGRLLKEDLLDHIRMLASQPKVELVPIPSPTTSASSAGAATGASSYLEQDTVVALSPMQKMMVKSMNAALQVPHFGYADEVQMDALYQLRQDLKPLAEQRGIKLSFMPFIIKAASLALKQYPNLNATVSSDETSVTYIAAHNISVAMDTPAGLIVPNVKDVQRKSILEIAEELNRLQQLATAGKLSVADLTGGTFSISNIGSIGGTYMGPVILLPQVAIGAIGKIQTLPRFLEDGSVAPVRLMNVSWSGDHRVIDGATMARFSNQWKQYLETPVAMLSEMS